MRKFPRAGGVAIGALGLTTCVLAATPAGGQAPRATVRAAGISFAGVMPGRPMALARGGGPAGIREALASRMRSTNWAGYAATKPPKAFRYVQATFFVPYINCAETPNSVASNWVGFDGVNDTTVEQVGVLSACRGTNASERAWFEMYPKFPVYLSMAVSPGNSIVASVYYDRHSGKFRLNLDDTTDGHRFSRAVACPSGSRCRRSTAEVISEAPTSGSRVLPLADFGAESFSGVRITDQAGHRSRLRSAKWGTERIAMVSGDGRSLDEPTAIYRGRTFGNYWQSPD